MRNLKKEEDFHQIVVKGGRKETTPKPESDSLFSNPESSNLLFPTLENDAAEKNKKNLTAAACMRICLNLGGEEAGVGKVSV